METVFLVHCAFIAFRGEHGQSALIDIELMKKLANTVGEIGKNTSGQQRVA